MTVPVPGTCTAAVVAAGDDGEGDGTSDQASYQEVGVVLGTG